MRIPLPCFKCNKMLGAAFNDDRYERTPAGGVTFGTLGNYGSRVLDMGWSDARRGDSVEINICDECLVTGAEADLVLWAQPTHTPPPPPKLTPWRPGVDDPIRDSDLPNRAT